MTQNPEPKAPRDPLERVLARTRAGMVVEALLRAFWPLGALLGFAWSALAFGVADLLTRLQLLALLAVLGLLALVLLGGGIARLAWPSRAAARARVDATLPGRPLAALRDTLALGASDPGARAVWEAHAARMRRLASAARAVRPDLRLASRDPFALRLAALVALIAALVFAGSDGLRQLPAVLAPGAGTAVASGPSFEGWAVPPAYTGRPTLYLSEVPPDQPVRVPAGTRITLRAYGAAERFGLDQSVAAGPPVALAEAAPGIASAEFVVDHDGSVAIAQGGQVLGQWRFVSEPDSPPTIALARPVDRAPGGETQLAYEADDDHGITEAHARLTLDLAAIDRRYGLAADPVPRPAIELDLPLPMTGGKSKVEETLVQDFSKEPWAGLPVTLTLTAEDGGGQTGSSGPIPITLPQRPFYDPLAAALIEQRRDLLWSPDNAPRIVDVLRAITNHPESLFKTPRAYLVTRAAIDELAAADAAGQPEMAVDPVAEALWQAALVIEDGSLGDAKERMDRARDRLSEALKDEAPDDEIARLMDELRQATQDYMRQMAEQAQKRGDQQQAEGADQGQTVTQDQIQQLMDQIQQLSEQGRKEEADQLLGMLQQLLDNMQMMLGQGSQGQGQSGPGQKAMQGLADALRKQQGLADDSFDQLQRQFRDARRSLPGADGQPEQPGQGDQGREPDGQPGADGSQGNPSPSDQGTLAERQESLRRQMDQAQRSLPGEIGDAARQAMRDAERSMGAARDKLRDGDTAGALDRQSEAIDKLREGMHDIAEDLRQADTGGEGNATKEGQADKSGGRDPLGRPMGAMGGVGSDRTMVPDADSAARARGLLDEIRRRVGEQTRPPLELDYLRRLLDQF